MTGVQTCALPISEINLFNEKNNGETILNLIKQNLIQAAHDVSLGGIITAIAKMCIKGKKGILIKKPNYLINQFKYLFGEDQGRYIIEIKKDDFKNVKEVLDKSSVHYDELGIITEKDLIIDEKRKITIEELNEYNKNWLKKYIMLSYKRL